MHARLHAVHAHNVEMCVARCSLLAEGTAAAATRGTAHFDSADSVELMRSEKVEADKTVQARWEDVSTFQVSTSTSKFLPARAGMHACQHAHTYVHTYTEYICMDAVCATIRAARPYSRKYILRRPPQPIYPQQEPMLDTWMDPGRR